MKIRFVSDSIRFRVRKSDLQKLQEVGQCQELVHFPGGNALIFSLGLWEGDTAKVDLQGDEIRALLPHTQAKAWINSSQVGLAYHLPVGEEKELHFLIEKDFPCKDRDEDIQDTFFELNAGDEAC